MIGIPQVLVVQLFSKEEMYWYLQYSKTFHFNFWGLNTYLIQYLETYNLENKTQ